MSSEEIRSSGMNDEKLVDEHVRLNEIKHEPTKGFLQAPLFLFLFLVVLFLSARFSLLIQLMIFSSIHPKKLLN